MTTRREFLRGAAGTAACAMAGGAIAAPTDGGIRAMLLQLGMNMWCDWFPEGVTPPWNKNRYRKPCLELAARDEVWRQVTDHMAAPARKLKGFMIAPWKALDDDPKNLAVNLRNVDLLAEAL